MMSGIQIYSDIMAPKPCKQLMLPQPPLKAAPYCQSRKSPHQEAHMSGFSNWHEGSAETPTMHSVDMTLQHAEPRAKISPGVF